MTVNILVGDCREKLDELPEKHFNTIVTSPPYWGLRDYQTGNWEGGDPNCLHMRTTKIGKTVKTTTGHQAMHDQGNVVGDAIYKTKCPNCGATRKDLQIGLEETPEEYVNALVEVFRKVWRVLRDDGTVWLNLGDSYCGTGHKGNHKDPKHKEGRNAQSVALNNKIQGLKQKDLVGIPWKVAFALQADGWYLRQDIIWHKPNPMPESVKDRCTKSHEYIFLLSKKKTYYYDHEAIKEQVVQDWGTRDRSKGKYHNEGSGLQPHSGLEKSYETKNKRSVWTVSPKPFHEAHFAVYPTELIEPCILAGCPEGGNVLDPFGGACTTGLVADRLKRNATLIELNEDYAKIGTKRLNDDAPLFTEVGSPF
jgi:DNA modification methylase